jgi:hypothetical protein
VQNCAIAAGVREAAAGNAKDKRIEPQRHREHRERKEKGITQ